MDPATYDEDVYQRTLLHKMRASETIVYEAVFVPASIAHGQTMLVAATSTGWIHVYRLDDVMTRTYWDQVACGAYACETLYI